jgi:F-type H+-transporting ATPase subunit gamma
MGLKDIKLRMTAIKKTAAITQAMHNIALSKIKKSTELFNHSDAFVNKLYDVIKYADQNIFESNRITAQNQGKTKLYVLVTSDRGLAGSYHNQLFKAFLEEIKDLDKDSYKVFVLGKKGYYFAQKRKLPMINEEIIYNRDDVSTMYFRPYAKIIKEVFLGGVIDQVILYHNHFVNTGNQVVKKETILPIQFKDNQKMVEKYIYDVAPEVVLDQTLIIFIESVIFKSLTDAKLSEHAARMIAMKNATDNANDIVEKLSIVYNKARQAEITSELIDVINGANV